MRGRKPLVDENVLFNKLNAKCLGCKHQCKQPSVVVIMSCPQYEKKEKRVSKAA